MDHAPVVAERESILSRCLACLVTETGAQHRTLDSLARRTGFADVRGDSSHAGFPEAGDCRLPYFLFHCQIGHKLLHSAIGRIRADPGHRFCPAVLVAGECSETEVVRYINLGFDDIVVLPEAARVLERRLGSHFDSPVSYFETASYFGPDRRRSLRLTTPARPHGRPGDHSHIRYLIQRTTDGVEVLRREVVLTSTHAPARVSATAGFGFG